MEYLIIALLVLVIVLLVVSLLRKRSVSDPVLEGKIDALAGGNSDTRKELLSMLEQYRSSMNRDLSAMDSRTTTSLTQIRMENSSQLEQYRDSVTKSINSLNAQVAQSLVQLRVENGQKLETMRQSVDARLGDSLSKSFAVVSDQLQQVHQGLGEMKELAHGVGDLKRLMGNIKVRGTMGEVQAQRILEDILLPSQYDRNVICKQGSNCPVEFAVRLPGNGEEVVRLPVDCKFPKEDYERLLNAQEAGDRDMVDASIKALRSRVLEEAKDIADKYVDPPHTTDFALLFLPFEGLYAEVLRIPGLVDDLQRNHRVVLSGPTTLAAILNSLQMGFRTLAIEKRSEEVWNVLSAVKSEFAQFNDTLEKAKQKIDLASASIDSIGTRTRVMGRKLKDVETIDGGKAEKILEEE